MKKNKKDSGQAGMTGRRGAGGASPGIQTLAIWGLIFVGSLITLGLLGIATQSPAVAISALWGMGIPIIGIAQAHGSNARFIFVKENTNKTNPTLLLESCEAAWTQGTVNTTVTADTSIFKQGSKSCKMVVGVDAAAGDILAYKAITSVSLVSATKVGFWIYSTVALAAGDLALLLDDTAACATPIETIDIPAITAAEINTWVYRECTIATPASCTAIISVGIKMVVDKGAFTCYVDDLRYYARKSVIFPMKSCNLATTQARVKSECLTGSRNPRTSTPGAITGSGSIPTELNPYMNEFWEQVMGQVTTTDLTGGKYKHEFTIKNNPLPTSTGEVQQSDITMFRAFRGLAVNGFDLSVNAEGKLALGTDWIPAVEDTDTLETTLDGAPIDNGHSPFDSFEIAAADVLVGGSASADVSNFSLSYKNNRDGMPTIGSAGIKDSLPGGIADITGKIDFLLKNNDVYQLAKANTESSIKITATKGTGDGSAGNEKIEIDLQELKYDVPVIDVTDKPMVLSVPFIAHYDDGAAASALKVSVWNTQSAMYVAK